MVRSVPPQKNLEEVETIAACDSEIDQCNLFGILEEELKVKNGTYWNLIDEYKQDGVKVRLCDRLEDYPKAQPGDIVRIHRVGFDRNFKEPKCPVGRNVVVWPAFRYNPTPLTKAKKPTIDRADNQKRRQLEDFFCSTINTIGEILSKSGQSNPRSLRVAGRVESVGRDQFDNVELEFSDGTGKIKLRTFPKKQPMETNDHYDLAKSLQVGDFLFANSLRRDANGRPILNLSSNLARGRCLRKVEPESILGIKLSETINKDRPQRENSNPSPKPRRSLRLNGNISQDIVISQQPATTTATTANQQAPEMNLSDVSSQELEERGPNYIKIAEIKDRDGFFKFYDIAGQVRGIPHEGNFGHYIIQLYDGSCHSYQSYFVDEVVKPVDNCVVVRIYAKKRPEDTDKHIEAAKKLNEGDLVLLKNVKVTFIQKRIRLEMSANLDHGKSINVIDKNSPLGMEILELVTNPMVEELVEDPLNMSADYD